MMHALQHGATHSLHSLHSTYEAEQIASGYDQSASTADKQKNTRLLLTPADFITARYLLKKMRPKEWRHV